MPLYKHICSICGQLDPFLTPSSLNVISFIVLFVCLFVYLKITLLLERSRFFQSMHIFLFLKSTWGFAESALASFLQRLWPFGVGGEAHYVNSDRQVKKRMGKGGGSTQGAVGRGRIKGEEKKKRKKKREVRALWTPWGQSSDCTVTSFPSGHQAQGL